MWQKEFDTPTIMVVLNSKNIKIEGKTPGSRISSVLSKLCERNKIEMTSKGSGENPNSYKLIQKSETDIIGSNVGFDVQPHTPNEGN